MTVYEVWTHGRGLGTLLFAGTHRGCKIYIRQAVSKGADKENIVLLRRTKKGVQICDIC